MIFCGAVGKSGQLPLHVWLPDAMEGPTPVSALIHAATMVAAGVYLVARVYPLMSAAGERGAAGGRLGGRSDRDLCRLVAVAQDDIKRILAYSTVSQLGYMMIGHRRGRGRGGRLPPDCPCIFQSAPVSWRRIGDPRLHGRAGHSRNGRPPQVDAGDLCHLRGGHPGIVRVPFILLRVLEQRRDPACCLWVEHLTGALLSWLDRCTAHGVLHDPPGLLRLFRQAAQGSSAGPDCTIGDCGVGSP